MSEDTRPSPPKAATRLRITLDVDPAAMFDAIFAANDGGAAIGVRLAGLLLTGKYSFAEQIALRVYGVDIHAVQRVTVPQQPGAPGEATSRSREVPDA